MTWKIKVKIRRQMWLFVVWLLWHISEALRKDYMTYLEWAWEDGKVGREFDEWLRDRIFGDEGGYRYGSWSDEEHRRLSVEVGAANRSVSALTETLKRQRLWVGMGQYSLRHRWWAQPALVPAPGSPGDSPYVCAFCHAMISQGHADGCVISLLMTELQQIDMSNDELIDRISH